MTRLIDADELVRKEIAFVGGPRSGGKTLAMIHSAIRHIVDNAPTVIAEPVRHGKWVDATGALDSVRQYKCSECGKKPILNEHWCFELTKFCPHCGAKMED